MFYINKLKRLKLLISCIILSSLSTLAMLVTPTIGFSAPEAVKKSHIAKFIVSNIQGRLPALNDLEGCTGVTNNIIYNKVPGKDIGNLVNTNSKPGTACCVVFLRMASRHENEIMNIIKIPAEHTVDPHHTDNYYYYAGASQGIGNYLPTTKVKTDKLSGFGSVTVMTNSASCMKGGLKEIENKKNVDEVAANTAITKGELRDVGGKLLNAGGKVAGLPLVLNQHCGAMNYTIYDRVKGSEIGEVENKSYQYRCCLAFYRMASGHTNEVMKVLDLAPKKYANPKDQGQSYYYSTGLNRYPVDNLAGFGSVTVKTDSPDCGKKITPIAAVNAVAQASTPQAQNVNSCAVTALKANATWVGYRPNTKSWVWNEKDQGPYYGCKDGKLYNYAKDGNARAAAHEASGPLALNVNCETEIAKIVGNGFKAYRPDSESWVGNGPNNTYYGCSKNIMVNYGNDFSMRDKEHFGSEQKIEVNNMTTVSSCAVAALKANATWVGYRPNTKSWVWNEKDQGPYYGCKDGKLYNYAKDGNARAAAHESSGPLASNVNCETEIAKIVGNGFKAYRSDSASWVGNGPNNTYYGCSKNIMVNYGSDFSMRDKEHPG